MKLEPNLHTLVWGTESWEVSAHRSSPSIIADGPDKGKTLSEVKPGFPLLIKVIDAKTRLSVQVHPGDEYALKTEGKYGKTEAWVILNAEPGAKLIFGIFHDRSHCNFHRG